jgi:hypothetical protein
MFQSASRALRTLSRPIGQESDSQPGYAAPSHSESSSVRAPHQQQSRTESYAFKSTLSDYPRERSAWSCHLRAQWLPHARTKLRRQCQPEDARRRSATIRGCRTQEAAGEWCAINRHLWAPSPCAIRRASRIAPDALALRHGAGESRRGSACATLAMAFERR